MHFYADYEFARLEIPSWGDYSFKDVFRRFGGLRGNNEELKQTGQMASDAYVG